MNTIHWISKSEGIFELDGRLRKMRQEDQHDAWMSFDRNVWGHLNRSQDRQRMLEMELSALDEKLRASVEKLVRRFSNIEVQRSLCRQLYRKYATADEAVDSIAHLRCLSETVYNDLARKIRMTFHHLDKKKSA